MWWIQQEETRNGGQTARWSERCCCQKWRGVIGTNELRRWTECLMLLEQKKKAILRSVHGFRPATVLFGDSVSYIKWQNIRGDSWSGWWACSPGSTEEKLLFTVLVTGLVVVLVAILVLKGVLSFSPTLQSFQAPPLPPGTVLLRSPSSSHTCFSFPHYSRYLFRSAARLLGKPTHPAVLWSLLFSVLTWTFRISLPAWIHVCVFSKHFSRHLYIAIKAFRKIYLFG